MSETATLAPSLPIELSGAQTPQGVEVNPLLPEMRSDFMHELRNESVYIDEKSDQLYPNIDISLPGSNKFEVTVIAEVALPEGVQDMRHLAILRLKRKEDGSEKFAIAGLAVDPKDGKATATSNMLLPLNDSETLIFGRSTEKPGEESEMVSGTRLWEVPYSDLVSSRHCSIKRENGSIIITDTSMNGTKYVASKREKDDEYVREHTTLALKKAEREGLLNVKMENGDEVKVFGGRLTIDRDSEIGGDHPATVDIRPWVAGAEAIVVDDSNPEITSAYQEYVDTVMNKIKQTETFSGRPLVEDDVTHAIYRTILEKMKYDKAYVTQQSDALKTKDAKLRKINLSVYLSEGKGVCRHMALMAAWLGGEFKAMGYLSGKMTAEVNQKYKVGAHEWARYTDANGKITILDPAQKYYGNLDYASKWDYRRPEEK